jgi:hypothetical protein
VKIKTITDVCIVFMMIVVLVGLTKDAVMLAIRLQVLRNRAIEYAEVVVIKAIDEIRN